MIVLFHPNAAEFGSGVFEIWSKVWDPWKTSG